MKYFTLSELTASATAQRLGIDNRPSPQAVHNLMRLTDQVLDPVRELWGNPLRVTSGYRCPALNKRVGGAPNSQHLLGQAADIVVQDSNLVQNYRLFCLIRDSQIPFDQLIAEKCHCSKAAHTCQWVHVSFSDAHRRTILSI